VTQALRSSGAEPLPPPRKERERKRRRSRRIGKDAAAAILAAQPADRPAPLPAGQPPTPDDPPRGTGSAAIRSEVAAVDPAIAPVVRIGAGPPPIEVEYVFGGAVPDGVVPVTTIAVLPQGPAQHDAVDTARASTPSLLDRTRRSLRRR
jgi:hypothetical protein